MNIREALQRMSPNLTTHRAAADEIARLDAQLAEVEQENRELRAAVVRLENDLCTLQQQEK